jgi:hypothetical protein
MVRYGFPGADLFVSDYRDAYGDTVIAYDIVTA